MYYGKLYYISVKKFLNSKIFCYLKKSVLTKPVFISSKVQQKQYNFEIFLLFKITVFYSSLQSHDPSEIILICWFAAQILLLLLLLLLLKTADLFFFYTTNLKCPYYGLWKVHILVLGVPNNRLTCIQAQKTLSYSYNMHLFLPYLLNDSQRFVQRFIFPNPSFAWR